VFFRPGLNRLKPESLRLPGDCLHPVEKRENQRRRALVPCQKEEKRRSHPDSWGTLYRESDWETLRTADGWPTAVRV